MREEIRIKEVGAKLNDQSEAVLRGILEDGEDVVIGASAGTGKTTLLTNILAEAIIRQVESSKPNPLDSIIAVTFTVEAARQMKEKTREILELYNEPHPLAGYDQLIYELETQSWISTIDSLTQRIIRMVALDIGLPPEAGLIDEYDNSRILTGVFNEVSSRYPTEIEFLEAATRERTKELLTDALNSMSLYVVTDDELLKRIKQSFTTFYSEDEGLGENSAEIKKHNRQVMSSLTKVLPGFVSGVRTKYRQDGVFTYDELRRLTVEFLRSDRAAKWREYFGGRFKYLLIDEFQDTSVVQTELLAQIAGKDTRIMVIGDPKQSIYAWRNAEPAILSAIIHSAERGKPDACFRRTFKYRPITWNFRSVRALVELANHFFSEAVDDSIFEDEDFTRGLLLPNPEVETRSPLADGAPENTRSIHYFFTAARGRGPNKSSEAEYVAHLLGKLGNRQMPIRVRKEIEGEWTWTEPTLGDCAVLIPRRSRQWSQLRDLLIRNNIPYVMIQDQGFYQRPEISLLVDFLDWLGDPYQNDALMRIMRSPFIGASDFALRVLTSERFRLDLTVSKLENLEAKTNKSGGSVIKRDLIAFKRVMNLKRNLRWSREGRPLCWRRSSSHRISERY